MYKYFVPTKILFKEAFNFNAKNETFTLQSHNEDLTSFIVKVPLLKAIKKTDLDIIGQMK